MTVFLALDIGEKRTGLALAEPPVYLAHPFSTIETAQLAAEISVLIKSRSIDCVVVGFPRNQAGEPTTQSKMVEQIVSQLQLPESVKLEWQDESLTSVKAEAELESRGKSYEKKDVDMLAATYILEDYLKERR